MDSLILKNLLTEYENKQRLAIRNSEEKKLDFDNKHPEIKKIEDEISKRSIEYSKEIIKAPAENKEKLLEDYNLSINKLKFEKAKILKSLGVSSSFFEPEYTCKTCKDTGFVLKNGKSEMCSCLKQKIFDLEYNNFDDTLNIERPLSNEWKNYFQDSITKNITLVATIDDLIVWYLIWSL